MLESLPRIAQTTLTEHARQVAVRSVASRIVLALAIMGLFVGVVRTHRFDSVAKVFPSLLPSTSSVGLIVVSLALLITSRGLRRGSRLAWVVTLAALLVSVVLHAAQGLPVFGSLVVTLGAGWLVAQGRCFPVLPTQWAARAAKTVGIVLAVAIVTLALVAAYYLATGEFDAQKVSTADRWLHRPLLRDLIPVFFLALLWSLVAPHRPRHLLPGEHTTERERARGVVAQWGTGSLDYFALRDDKDWFFVGNSVVAHSVRSGVCLVSPDPIGPPEERAATWAEFLDHATGFGWSVAVVGAAESWLPVYEASGLRSVYLGDEAVVNCTDFTLVGGEHKSLRQAVNRVERAGYTTEFHDPRYLDPDLAAQVLAIAEESRHGESERGFSMTLSRLLDPHDDRLILAVTRNAEGRVDAYCQWTPAAEIDGLSLDVMRRRITGENLPNGLLDATVVATIREVAQRGMSGLALNFAVMRQVLDNERPTRFESLTRPILNRLSQSTQMATLGAFNEKFKPRWQPRYLLLDSAEYVATQALVVADAEGVTEIPVIGRYLGTNRQSGRSEA